MKILMTVHTYIPNTDGVQFVTKYLAEGLADLGHYVQIITYMYPDRCSIKSENINGVNVLRWDASTRHTFHRGDKKGYQKYILKNQNKYDVMINVGTQTALTDWLFEISDYLTIPRLLYIHSIWDFGITKDDFISPTKFVAKVWANLRWGIYYHKNGTEFRKYGCVTQLHEKDTASLFFLNRYGIKSKIIENAAEQQFFELGMQRKKDKGEHCIINVANFNKRKNQKKCIELFCMAEIPSNWKLILIGSSENDYVLKLKELIKKYHVDGKLSDVNRISIITGVGRNMIYEYVANSDLYLMTSTWEAFPISLIESVATGVPFISSDVGIVKYIEGGYVAESDEKFLELLKEMTHNDELRRRIGEEGRKSAIEHYRVENKVKQLEKYLLELC